MQSNCESAASCAERFAYPTLISKVLVTDELGLFINNVERSSRMLGATCNAASQISTNLRNSSTEVGTYTQDPDLGKFLSEAVVKVQLMMTKVCLATSETQFRLNELAQELTQIQHDIWNVSSPDEVEMAMVDTEGDIIGARGDISAGLLEVYDAAFVAQIDIRERLDKIHSSVANVRANPSAPPFNKFLSSFAASLASGTNMIRLAVTSLRCPFAPPPV